MLKQATERLLKRRAARMTLYLSHIAVPPFSSTSLAGNSHGLDCHIGNCDPGLKRHSVGTGLWMSEESVGDAGPSNLGYFGGCWSPQGDQIVAHGYTGALHLWRRDGMLLT